MQNLTIHDLSPKHKDKVISAAKDWRCKNSQLIHNLILHRQKLTHNYVKGEQPIGAVLFEPKKWDATNWVWFTEVILHEGFSKPRYHIQQEV